MIDTIRDMNDRYVAKIKLEDSGSSVVGLEMSMVLSLRARM